MEGTLDYMQFDVVILGAGAAGLFCAMHAARRGRRVLVLEHNSRPGRKILISGGGRCNFTNLDVRPECFLSDNPHFAKSALARYRPRDFIALLELHRIRWHEKTLGQLFCDDSSQQILDMLLSECRDAGAEVRCDSRVTRVSHSLGAFDVNLGSESVRTTSLVVATGGPSIPKIGATGFAYDLARQFGLRVIRPRPALVPLTLNPHDLRCWGPLSGVATTVQVRFGARTFDERMLFTHRGLSGPAILQISSYWQPGQPIQIDLAPGHKLAEALLKQKRDNGRILPRTCLQPFMPDRMAAAFAGPETGLDRPLMQIADSTLRQHGDQLHRWEITPAGTEGFDKAEVAAGGVDTKELSSQTMEARRALGLFFIGECVDVTGWLGGYNYQWAWASAIAAAQAA